MNKRVAEDQIRIAREIEEAKAKEAEEAPSEDELANFM
jgi:hypothetical protein